MNSESSPKLCECGCGTPTNLIEASYAAKGLVRGEYRRFVRGHQRRRGHVPRIYPADYEIADGGYKTPCWKWLLALNYKGYATVNRLGNVNARRIAYEQFREPVPRELVIDHLCRNRWCVNPWHMEPVTPLENTRRGLMQRMTPETEREIIELRAIGMSYPKIGKIVGFSATHVSEVARGHPRRPLRRHHGPTGLA